MNKWVKRAIIAVPLLVALVYGAIFLYAKVINNPDPPLTIDDARELAAATAPAEPTDPVATVAEPGTTVDPTTAPTQADAAATQADAAATGTVDGLWLIAPGSEFGYRVNEVLGGVSTTATGRGGAIDGSITIDGGQVVAGSFTVEVASIESDNGLRDQQFRGRVMNTAEFPEATFALTEPIELAMIPEIDAAVQATATGELTMHGVTQPVSFEVEAVRGGRRIAVVGSIPILFADYGIDNPSTSMVTTEDDGLLEFNLAFERA